ncbi:hypothetical protein C8Q77DRAFT_1072023 [Trametes polyzona]|nr:hypothetical protein C8Q77DRAFT_1072023 [Trametes polyzona]
MDAPRTHFPSSTTQFPAQDNYLYPNDYPRQCVDGTTAMLHPNWYGASVDVRQCPDPSSHFSYDAELCDSYLAMHSSPQSAFVPEPVGPPFAVPDAIVSFEPTEDASLGEVHNHPYQPYVDVAWTSQLFSGEHAAFPQSMPRSSATHSHNASAHISPPRTVGQSAFSTLANALSLPQPPSLVPALETNSAHTVPPLPSPHRSSPSPGRPSFRPRRNAPARTSDAPSPHSVSEGELKWSCPHCDYVQRNGRMPELRRHIKTHTRPEVVPWICCGVPFAEAAKRGVPQKVLTEQPFEYNGMLFVGGCGEVVSRRDALGRHLRNSKRPCYGDPNGPWLLGNAMGLGSK